MKRRFKKTISALSKKNGLWFYTRVVCVILMSGTLIGCAAVENGTAEEGAEEQAVELTGGQVEELAGDQAKEPAGSQIERQADEQVKGQTQALPADAAQEAEEKNNPAAYLSMDDLVRITEDNRFQSVDFSAYENGERDNLGDDALNYEITFALAYEGHEYQLALSFMKDTDNLDAVRLTKEVNGETALLYSSDARYEPNRNIREFLAYDDDIHDDIRYQLPGGLTETDFHADFGFAGGVLLQPDAYEVFGDENEQDCPPEWKAAGMVSRFFAEGVVAWNGERIAHIYQYSNHTSSEEINFLDGLCAPAFLLKASHDLYTASELAELEEAGVNIEEIDTTSDYWNVYFAKPGDEVGYVISLNAKNYTMEDVLAFAESVEYLQE